VLICRHLLSNRTESLQQDLVSLESEKNSEIDGLRASLTQKEQDLAHQQTEAEKRKGEEVSVAQEESAQVEKTAQELEGFLFFHSSSCQFIYPLIFLGFPLLLFIARVQEKSKG